MYSVIGIGLMSGSSLDGLDLAAVQFSPVEGWANEPEWEILVAETQPYNDEWTRRLSGLRRATGYDLAKTDADYGHLLGMAVRQFCIRNGLKPDFVASHGHTALHQPHRHFTLQIGSGETLASHLDCPAVTNFRARDVALGGQGAPLAPGGELALFPEYRCFLNLGGIANLSFLQREGEPEIEIPGWKKPGWRHLAYDVAFCNQVLNELARRAGPELEFDGGGEIARSGSLVPRMFEALEGLPFYQLYPPRSLGREWIEDEVLPLLDAPDEPPEDLLHTCVRHIARRIAAEFERFGLREMDLMVTGGGAFNVFLMECLAEELAPQNVALPPVAPQLVEYKEALVFAYLGLLALAGKANNLRGATGAREAAVCGSLHRPRGAEGPALFSDRLRAFRDGW